MAKASAKMMMPMMPPPPAMALPARMSAKTPHGMSLQARPQRPPHPVHKGRDAFGRMMPGQLPPGAASPFTMQNIPPQMPVAMGPAVKPMPKRRKG